MTFVSGRQNGLSIYQLFPYLLQLSMRGIFTGLTSPVSVCVSYRECKVLGSVPGTDRCFNDFRQWQTKWPPYIPIISLFTSIIDERDIYWPHQFCLCHTASARYWVQFPVQTDVLMTFVSGRQNGLRIYQLFPYLLQLSMRGIFTGLTSPVCVCVSYSECKVLGSVPGTDRSFNDFHQWQTKWPPYIPIISLFTSIIDERDIYWPHQSCLCHTASARYWVQFPVQTDVLMTFVSGRQNGLRIYQLFPYLLQLSMRGIFTGLTSPVYVSVSLSLCHTLSARYWVQFPVVVVCVEL